MMATAVARETEDTGLRERCRRTCLPALRRLGAAVSLVCRWLRGAQVAAAELDDEHERRSLEEARRAQWRFIRAVDAAARDGRITPAERVVLQFEARRMSAELADVVAYNEREDPAHAQIVECLDRARENAAQASLGLDAAQNAAGPRNGGAEAVWADVDATTTG